MYVYAKVLHKGIYNQEDSARKDREGLIISGLILPDYHSLSIIVIQSIHLVKKSFDIFAH